MSFALAIGFAIVVVGVVLPFILGPLVVRLAFRQSAEPALVPLGDDQAPAGVPEFLDTQTEALAGVGFTTEGRFALEGFTPNVVSYLALLAHPVERAKAIVAVNIAERGAKRMEKRYVEFSSEYVDGHDVCTNNSDELVVAAFSHDKTISQLPRISDAARLFRVHQQVVNHQLRPRSTLREVPLGDGLGEQLLVELGAQVRDAATRGYLAPEADAVTHRLTAKGACLITWGMLWPVSTVRKLRQRATERALLRELGLGAEEVS